MFKSLTRCSSSLALSFLALSFLFSSPISAQVIEIDSDIFGPGTLTRDTVQGLDFLDLEDTLGRSFQDVSSQLGSGGEFEGFRYATFDEIESLVSNYNSPATPPGTPRLTALLDVATNLFGSDFSTGLSADLGPDGGIQIVSIIENTSPRASQTIEAAVDRVSNTTGSFLVTSSSAVPEPNSVSLCAVLFMGVLARRKKQPV